MLKMQKSALFMRQWKRYAQDYKERASPPVAERFITAVEEALGFIHRNPHACGPYDGGEGYEDLQAHKFRKWNLQHFPHLILFRLADSSTIFIEVIYAHKMHIASRLSADKE